MRPPGGWNLKQPRRGFALRTIGLGALLVLAVFAIMGLLTVALYRAATDPCRCEQQKCWLVQGVATDTNGFSYPTSHVDCRCLKKWCPAESCE